MRTHLAAVVLALGASVALAGPAAADDKETVIVPSYPVEAGPVQTGTPSVVRQNEKDSFEESFERCMEDGYADYATDGDCDPKT